MKAPDSDTQQLRSLFGGPAPQAFIRGPSTEEQATRSCSWMLRAALCRSASHVVVAQQYFRGAVRRPLHARQDFSARAMSSTSTKAVRVAEWGGPEVLKVENVALPAPGPGQARVRFLCHPTHSCSFATGRDLSCRLVDPRFFLHPSSPAYFLHGVGPGQGSRSWRQSCGYVHQARQLRSCVAVLPRPLCVCVCVWNFWHPVVPLNLSHSAQERGVRRETGAAVHAWQGKPARHPASHTRDSSPISCSHFCEPAARHSISNCHLRLHIAQEGAGEVVQVGAGVSTVAPGARVWFPKCVCFPRPGS